MRTLTSVVFAALLSGASVAAAQRDSVGAPHQVPLRSDGNGIASLRAMVRVSVADVTVASALQTVARAAKLNLTFDPLLNGLAARVSLNEPSISAAAALLRIVRGTPLAISVLSNGQLIVVMRPAAVPDPQSAATGRIRGVVRDAGTGEPIEDVRVQVVGTRLAAASRGGGAFIVHDAPRGIHDLRFVRIGYEPLLLRGVALPDSGELVLDGIAMARAVMLLATVRVSPGEYGVMEHGVGSQQTLSREQIQTNPQLGEDIFRAVNGLPGLSSNDLSAKFHVRGGASEEVLVTLDGAELYEPFHLKDVDAALSIVDVDAIGGIDLSTGGFSSQWGDHLTGMFSMRSLEPSADGPRHSLGLSVTNLRGMSQGRFARSKGAWLVSVRRGYLDLALKLTDSRDSISPVYYDAFGKVQFDVSSGHRVGVHVLRSGDQLEYLPPNDPGINSRYGSSYAWTTWDAAFSDRLRASTVASLARLTWRRAGGLDSPDGVARIRAREARTFDVASLRQDWSFSLSPSALLRFGGEAKSMSASYDYLNWVRRDVQPLEASGERTVLFDTTRGVADPSGSSLGAYVTQRVRAGALVVEGGLRYDRQRYGPNEDQWSPRLSAAWTPREGTTVRAAWGRYSQPQPIHALQVQDGLTSFFPAEGAEHRDVGVEQRLFGVNARVEAYERRLSRPRPRFINALNALEVFPELTDDRIRIDPTSGLSRGLEFLLKTDAAGPGRPVEWSASYALARVSDVIDGRTVPRAVDQRHTVYLSAAYRAPSGKWRISIDWLYHSGWPYTPQYIRVDTIVDSRTAFIARLGTRLGPLHSERLPSYRRFDVRATRYVSLGSTRLAVYADIFNALNRDNARGYGYDVRFFPTRVTREIDGQVPRLPTVGVTWEF